MFHLPPPIVYAHALESTICAAGHVPRHLLIADMSERNTQPRLWALDLSDPEHPRITLQSYVAHGSGSDPRRTGFATQFSNVPDSNATSPGLYAVGEGYTGTHGWSYRLMGLDPQNSQAFSRDIMLHPSAFVRADGSHIGWSAGCAAVPTDFIPRLDQAWGTVSGAYLFIDGPGVQRRHCAAASAYLWPFHTDVDLVWHPPIHACTQGA